MNWLHVPKKIYFKPGSMAVALKELDEVYGLRRAFLVSDAGLYRAGLVRPVQDLLRKRGLQTAEFFMSDGMPSFRTVRSGLPKMLEFEPDVILGVGGGSVMSLAKLMWLQYENPDRNLRETAAAFHSTLVSDSEFPETGRKARLVLVATTAGSGAECTPYAVVKDDAGDPCVIAGYRLLPEMAVIDSHFSEHLPALPAKKTALLALTQAVRAYMAEETTDYVRGCSGDSARLILKHLPVVLDAIPKGTPVPESRYHLANAAALSGIAIGNAVDTLDPDAGMYPSEEERRDRTQKLLGLIRASGKEDFEDWFRSIDRLQLI